MSTLQPQDPQPLQKQKTYEDQLQEIYAYYDDLPKKKQQPQPQEQQDQQFIDGSEYSYEAYEYDAGPYANDYPFEQYEYSGSGKKETQSHGNCASQPFESQFAIQHQSFQQEIDYNSQPTAINRFQRPKTPQQKQKSANSSALSIFFSIQDHDRSVSALVSVQKNKKKTKKAPSKPASEHSCSSDVSLRAKIILQHKQKKKNGDKTIEPVFFSPFSSLPFEAMDFQGFQKFYRASHSQIFQKINDLHKKILILGQKAFFKDKQSEQSLDEIFKLMGTKLSNLGFKTTIKMGKGKSFREFKAIYKYLNMDNPEGSGSKCSGLGEGAKMIEESYIRQFKELMGYKQSQEQKQESQKTSLYGFGFCKPERKR